MAHTTRLAGPPGFNQRCDAIDRLELQLADFASDRGAGQPERGSALRDQAAALCQQLEQMNAEVVQGLRHEIAAGRCLGENLLHELQRYRAKPLESGTDGNLEYDSLDVLVAGILGTDRLLDEGPAVSLPEMVPYQPTPARIVLEVVEQTHLGPHDTFVDIGSGLGVVPALVSLLSGATSIGIEVQASYCRHAEEAVRGLNLANVSFVCQDARLADLSVGTVFYMYTPFKGAMLQQVLERLHAEGRRRGIRLCTYGPMLSEAVRQPSFPAFEQGPLAQGALAVFHTRPT